MVMALYIQHTQGVGVSVSREKSIVALPCDLLELVTSASLDEESCYCVVTGYVLLQLNASELRGHAVVKEIQKGLDNLKMY